MKAVVDGDGTLANPGYRAAGINVDYLAPTAVPINVEGTVYFSYQVTADEAKSIIDTAVTTFLNAHVIGEDAVRAQLQKVILDFPVGAGHQHHRPLGQYRDRRRPDCAGQ